MTKNRAPTPIYSMGSGAWFAVIQQCKSNKAHLWRCQGNRTGYPIHDLWPSRRSRVWGLPKQRHCNKFPLCYQVFKKYHMPRAEKGALLRAPGVILYANPVRLVCLAQGYRCLGMGTPGSQRESSLSYWRYYDKSWSLMGVAEGHTQDQQRCSKWNQARKCKIYGSILLNIEAQDKANLKSTPGRLIVTWPITYQCSLSPQCH